MKKLSLYVFACFCLLLLASGCGDDCKKSNRHKQKDTNDDDIVNVDWKMLGGNSYIYFGVVDIEDHHYIVSTRGNNSLTFTHAASCKCMQEKNK